MDIAVLVFLILNFIVLTWLCLLFSDVWKSGGENDKKVEKEKTDKKEEKGK
jgi:hypothetical protein